MSEWDKIWGLENQVVYKDNGDYNWEISKYYLYEIRAVGDENQRKLAEIQRIAEEYDRLSKEDVAWGWMIPPRKILDVLGVPEDD